MKKLNSFILAIFTIFLFACQPPEIDNIYSHLFGETEIKLEEKFKFDANSGDYGTLDLSIGTAEPQVTQGTDISKLVVTWADIPGATFCAIYRVEAEVERDENTVVTKISFPEEAEPIKVGEVAAAAKRFEDTSVANNKIYYYAVKGISEDKTREGLLSYFYYGYMIGYPENLRADDKESKEKIGISWDAIYGANNYQIFRAENDPEASYEFVGKSFSNYFEDHAKSNNPPSAGIKYYYKVKAFRNGVIESGFSLASNPGEIVSAFACDPPEKVYASRAEYNDTVKVWWDLADGADSYVVYRADSPDAIFEAITDIGDVTENAYLDTEIENGKDYYYQVSSINAAGMEGTRSKFEPFAETDFDGCDYRSQGYAFDTPEQPLVAFIPNGDGGSLFVYWNTVRKAETYSVYYKDTTDQETALIEDSTETFYKADLSAEFANFEYYIRAKRAGTEGEVLSKDSQSKLPNNGAPENLSGSVKEYELLGDGQIKGKNTISWKSAQNIQYRVLRKLPGESSFTLIADNVTSSPYIDTNIPERGYEFFHNLLPSVEPQGSEDGNQALQRSLSARYKIEAVFDAENNIFATSDEVLAMPMPTHKEFFFIIQFLDDCATNKLTNQSDYESTTPGDETDPGFLSGKIDFSAKIQSLSSANIKFKFTNYSDWHGLALTGEYNSLQHSNPGQPPGGSSINTCHTDSVSLIGLFNIKRNVSLRLNPDNSSYDGSIKINIIGVGDYTIIVSPEDNIFHSYDGTDRIPGGRNASGSSGNENTYDSGTLSKFAILTVRGDNLSAAGERAGTPIN
ncbi:MAG: hypothetical protein JXR63_11115 [Spirochaetales bacterium]|nr:hypothetical protein [Spirochaetales bacterium]